MLSACVTVFGLIFLVMATPSEPAEAPRSPLWFSASCLLLAVGCLCLTVRIFRSGIFADTEGVTFRNILRTTRIGWGEILRFEPPKPYGALRAAGLSARLKDGRQVASSLYQTGLTSSPGFATAALTTLNAILVDHLNVSGQLDRTDSSDRSRASEE